MATTYKVLGQASPAITTETALYTVPAATQAVVSSIVICNRDTTTNSYRISVRPAGATLANQHYLAFDTDIPGKDTISMTLGLSLGNTDVISVYTKTGNISYSAFGAEIT